MRLLPRCYVAVSSESGGNRQSYKSKEIEKSCRRTRKQGKLDLQSHPMVIKAVIAARDSSLQ